jgi:hypothetical protein
MRPSRILFARSWASLTLGIWDLIEDAEGFGRICGAFTFDSRNGLMPTSRDLPVEELPVEEWLSGTRPGPGHPDSMAGRPTFGARIRVPTVFQDGAFSAFLDRGQKLLRGEGDSAHLLAETGPDTTYRWLEPDKGILLVGWQFREAALYSGLEIYEPWWSAWMDQRPGAPLAETVRVEASYLLATRRQFERVMRAAKQLVEASGGLRV